MDTKQTSRMREIIASAKAIQEDLHEHPEAFYKETYTTKRILEEVDSCREILGGSTEIPSLEVIDIGMETGAVVWLNLGKKETIALRADIDAVATETGFYHLCGHDYHTASLLGAMRYLCSASLREAGYNVLFIFQPAEESTDGAKAMLSHGLMEKLPQKPVRLFGIHNRPEIPVGKIAVHQGALMAEKNDYILKFTGKAGHGGSPHHCIDPITAGAQFVMAMQTVVSKNVDPLESATCGVFSFHSGSDVNNPPDDAVVTGTIRSLSHDAFVRMVERVEQIAKSCADCFECECDFQWIPLVPLLYNGPEMYKAAYLAAKETVGKENIVDTEPTLGSDDFAVFGKEVPAFYYWVGSGPRENETQASDIASERDSRSLAQDANTASLREALGKPWHDSEFCVADGYLDVAIPLLVNAALGGKKMYLPGEKPERKIVC